MLKHTALFKFGTTQNEELNITVGGRGGGTEVREPSLYPSTTLLIL
jgi:hypothetical protein